MANVFPRLGYAMETMIVETPRTKKIPNAINYNVELVNSCATMKRNVFLRNGSAILIRIAEMAVMKFVPIKLVQQINLGKP